MLSFSSWSKFEIMLRNWSIFKNTLYLTFESCYAKTVSFCLIFNRAVSSWVRTTAGTACAGDSSSRKLQISAWNESVESVSVGQWSCFANHSNKPGCRTNVENKVKFQTLIPLFDEVCLWYNIYSSCIILKYFIFDPCEKRKTFSKPP